MTNQLFFQAQAGRFATHVEDVAETSAIIRANGVRDALTLIDKGQPGRAYLRVMRSWRDQVRVAGLGYAGIPGLPYESGGPLDVSAPGGAS